MIKMLHILALACSLFSHDPHAARRARRRRRLLPRRAPDTGGAMKAYVIDVAAVLTFMAFVLGVAKVADLLLKAVM